MAEIRAPPVSDAGVNRAIWLNTYVLLPLARFLDRLLWRVLDPRRVARRRLDPDRLIKKASALARCEPRFHVSTEEIRRRLNAAADQLARASDQDALRGCAVGGGDLRVGLAAVAVLERRLTRQLVADLHVTRALALAPAHFATGPGAPLVVVGPPRSGTTLLLELLACDETTWRRLECREAVCPCVVGDAAAVANATRVAETMLAGQQVAFDAVKHIHYEAWDGPTECRMALENGGGAPYVQWWVFGLTDALDAWLEDDEARESDYAFYRRQLAAIRLAAAAGDAAEAASDDRAWLLKDPAHLFSLDALFAAFPAARVVWLHRDPRASAASLCSLLGNVWGMIHRRDAGAGPPRFRERVVEYLGKMLDGGLDFRRRNPGAKVHDLRMGDLVKDPMRAVEAIYAFAGEELPLAAGLAMREHVAKANRERKAGGHKYGCEDFGLDAAEVDARFSGYKAAFGV